MSHFPPTTGAVVEFIVLERRMSDDVVISVVVVMYNSAHLLQGLLASLYLGLRGLNWNLIFVDNASTDDSVESARRLAPEAIVVATGRNGGYAAGVNAGVRAAAGHTAVLTLNPDVRLADRCVAELSQALDDPGIGIAVPRLVNGDGELIYSMRREPTLIRMLADATIGALRAGRVKGLGEIVSDRRQYDRQQLTDWSEGSVMLISSECMSATAGWDESFFLYSEETDFALRARDLGYATSFVPTAHAVHLEGGSATNPALWPLVVRNRVRLYRRRHRLFPSLVFYAAVLCREATRAVLGRDTSRAALKLLLNPARMREQPGPRSIAPSLRV
jgi:N-acetylglucosaminyl-diphospho-decaprenol L-rhamnosyltransferase